MEKKYLFNDYLRIILGSYIKPIKSHDLLSILSNAYENYFQYNIKNFNRIDFGLQKIFNEIFPIVIIDCNVVLEFIDYKITFPIKNYNYCIENGLTYSGILNIKLRLVNFYNKIGDISDVKEIKEEDIYVANIPIMTKNVTFIINGVEKVIVSKFVRAPGLYLLIENRGKKIFHIARLVPDRGSEVDFLINDKNKLILRIKKREICIITLLKAVGYSDIDIINIFYDFEFIIYINNIFKLKFIEEFFLNFSIPYDILDSDNNIIINKNTILNKNDIKIIKELNIKYIDISEDYLLNRFLGCDLYVDTDKLANVNDLITLDVLEKIKNFKITKIKLIYITTNAHSSVRSTLINNNLNTFDCIELLNRFFNSIGFSILVNDLLSYRKSLFNQHLFYILHTSRSRINFRLNRNTYLGANYLTNDDIIDIIKFLIAFKDGVVFADDMQSLNNLNLSLSANMIGDIIYNVLLNIKKNINKKTLNFKKNDIDLIPSKILNFSLINIDLKEFFNTSEYSQFLDQINVLSELSHKRRVTFIGVLGISKRHSGFDVRDLHSSHYSRLCPVETPEGINIGLIGSLSLFCTLDKYNFILSPYYVVKFGKIKNKIEYLNVDKELNSIIAEPTSIVLKNGYLKNYNIIARYNEQLITVKTNLVNYIDIRPYQILSVSASLIPFIEHNDSNRALMASNMLRQALPCLYPQKPLIGTNMENLIGLSSNTVIISKSKGIVIYVDSKMIIIKNILKIKEIYYYDYDLYFLSKYRSSNQHTNMNQRAIVDIGDNVVPGTILCDGSSTDHGDLSLGQNMLIAFMPWRGYNFEDSVIVSEQVIINDRYTSLELIQVDISVFETNYGSEIITKKVYNHNKLNLDNLNEFGIIRIGSIVSGGDILVGKITPMSDTKLNPLPEDKLLHSIFSEKFTNDIDTSLYLSNNINMGVVTNVEVYFSNDLELSSLDIKILNNQIEIIINDKTILFKFFIKKLKKKIKNFLLNKKILYNINIGKDNTITKENLKNIKFYDLFKISLEDKDLDNLFKTFKKKFKNFLKSFKFMCDNIKNNKFIKKLPLNTSKIIKVFITIKKKLQVGDKMSGRHGNKGVVSKILPISDMPYMANGKIIDIILNPLGVPSRMNVGQLLEVHLGLASIGLGWKISNMLNKNFKIIDIRNLLYEIYNDDLKRKQIQSFSNNQIKKLAKYLKNGVPFGIPPFSNFKEKDINRLLDLAFSDNDLNKNIGLSETKKQIYLYDGVTGKKFDRPITVGVMYFLKLNHLVEDKIHARSVGPYSLITQQPLKGKSNMGGQRLGEMEVWALEAYGASYTLQEMITVKSDDIGGRFEIYKNIINGSFKFIGNRPETFDVMMKNINSLGMCMQFKEK